jgi:hypothetical protein
VPYPWVSIAFHRIELVSKENWVGNCYWEQRVSNYFFWMELRRNLPRHVSEVDSHERSLIRKYFVPQNVPSKPRVQRGPCRASGRTDPGVASWSCILEVLGDCRPSAGLVAAGQVDVGWAVVAGSSGAAEGMVRGKGLGRIRMDLGHRPCRLAHRTPVLYSRSQPRTNIAL